MAFHMKTVYVKVCIVYIQYEYVILLRNINQKEREKIALLKHKKLDSIVRACVGGKLHIKSKIHDARKRFQLDFIYQIKH